MKTVSSKASRKNTERAPTATRLSVDPGITGSGLALWSEEKWEQAVAPVLCLNIYPKPSRGIFSPRVTGSPATRWVAKAYSVSMQVHEKLELWRPTHLYCEQPEFFANEGGQMVAATGDLVKLTFIVGCFARSCWQLGIEFCPIPVREWKGQLPKRVVEKRIVSLVGPLAGGLDIKSHSWDATGIGLFAKGCFE